MNRLRTFLMLLAVLASVVVLAACGDDEEDDGGGGGGAGEVEPIERNPDNEGKEITIGSKNFTEQKILGEIYAQALAASGFTVEKELNLGDEATALRALRNGDIDAYPEYTGTALLSFFDVPTEDLPTDPNEAFEQVRDNFTEEGITAYPPTPFTSSNEVGLTQERAEELGVEKISDLAEHDQDLTLYGSPECRQRQDCLLGLQEVYDLDFQRFVPVAIDLRHEVLQNGDADVSIVFTTDPQIERDNLVLLEDDRNMFPPYNSTFLLNDEALEDPGDLPETIEKVQEGLTDEVMQELNARVDLDKETPEEVAKAYLEESGLVE